MTKFDYDLIAIGSGSAGGLAAFVAKRAEAKVAVVEEFKEKLGGNCPNYACVPTKALLKAAEVYREVKNAGQFGVYADNPRFDFNKIAEYRDGIVGQLTGMRIERNLKNAGIDWVWGRAKFVSRPELEIAGRRYSAANIVIGTGSKEFIPPIEGLAETGFIVSDQAARMDHLPKSVIIIGAGPVGTEFAQIFSSFGVKVTVLQRDSQILQREDPEAAALVEESLVGQGVKIVLNMEVISVNKEGSEKRVKVKVGNEEQEFRAEEIMIAAGRRAALEGLDLQTAGVAVTPSGKLELNEYLQTSQPHIWAAGDAAGNWQFTHTAAYEGDLVGRNIIHRHEEKVDYSVVPRVTFCYPEVASVGITEKEAQTKSLKVRVEKFSVGGMGRSLIERERRGFIKLVAEKETLQILGAHVAGLQAGQLVHELAVAMKSKFPITEVARMIHAYPSFSEAVGAAAEKFL